MNEYSIFLVIVMTGLLLFCSFSVFRKSLRGQFLLLSIVLGTIYSFIIPPFQVPDEFAHYYRAKNISHSNFIVRKYDNRLGGDVCEEDLQFAQKFSFLPVSKDAKIQGDFFDLNISGNYKCTKTFTDFPNTALYNPILYIPQSIGNYIFRYTNPFLSFVTGRIFSVFLWSITIYILCRNLPVHRQFIVYSFALFPVNVMIISSYSSDTVNNLASIAVITIVLENKKKLKSKDLVLLFFAFFVIAIGKLTSIPLFILFVSLIFSSKLTTKRKYISVLIIVFMIIFCFLFAFLNSTSMHIPYHVYNEKYIAGVPVLENVNPVNQVQFVLMNPISFLEIVWKSLMIDFSFIYKSSIGILGWLEFQIPSYKIFLFSIPPLIAIFATPNHIFVFKKIKIVFLLTSVALFLWFMVLMYAIWTPVAHYKVENLQGRYFFITILCMLQGIAPRHHKKKWSLFFLAFFILHCSVIGNIIYRYYLNAPFWLSY